MAPREYREPTRDLLVLLLACVQGISFVARLDLMVVVVGLAVLAAAARWR